MLHSLANRRIRRLYSQHSDCVSDIGVPRIQPPSGGKLCSLPQVVRERDSVPKGMFETHSIGTGDDFLNTSFRSLVGGPSLSPIGFETSIPTNRGNIEKM